MPHHKSAKKRLRQDKKRREANKAVKSAVKTAVKKVRAAETGEEAAKHLSSAESALDRAARKNVIHWRNAARKKSRLAKRVNSLSS
ncbi:MAG: 30S ribosomal protein S20 [Candidatus Eisenbacteria bacterium]